MPRNVVLFVLLLLWLAAIAASFMSYHITPAMGDGFTAGLNRVGVFLAWQLVAGAISVLIWRCGQKQQTGTAMRWLTRAPFILFIVPAVVLVLVLIWAVML